MITLFLLIHWCLFMISRYGIFVSLFCCYFLRLTLKQAQFFFIFRLVGLQTNPAIQSFREFTKPAFFVLERVGGLLPRKNY